jgi:hypothetical protein
MLSPGEALSAMLEEEIERLTPDGVPTACAPEMDRPRIPMVIAKPSRRASKI